MDINKKQKKRPTKIEEMTKEQIRQAIVKKRECNSRALKIVESLIETNVSEEYFLQCLPDINQSHLEDIIEERTIQRLCGYPLCSQVLFEKDILKQKYKISVKTNKVYDITARKNFCSNICYKAAMFVKKQMLTSPLWFREYERIPEFTMLPVDTVGSLGQEVDLALVQKVTIASNKNQSFTSLYDFANASLQDITKDEMSEDNKDINNDKSNEKGREDNENDKNTVNDKQVTNSRLATNIGENQTSKKDIKTKQAGNPLNIVGEIIEKPEQKVDPILINPPNKVSNKSIAMEKKTRKKQPSITIIAVEVEKCLAEWFTLDTMLLLFGEEKVREMVTDKKDCINQYLNSYTKGIFYNSSSYDQYQSLCRKLNLLELEERRSEGSPKKMKPLPDYAMLQEESKKMQLKVKAFFTAETEISAPVEKQEDNTLPEVVPNLPLVDKNAQNALRRRIVLQHLSKVLPDLLRSLGLLTLSISSDVHLLVNTFKLKANNVMFKPAQWTLIAIVVIKLLSLRDPRLAYLLKEPIAFQHMQLLLLSYEQDGGYLDRLISWLTDIDRLLNTNDTQLTTEVPEPVKF